MVYQSQQKASSTASRAWGLTSSFMNLWRVVHVIISMHVLPCKNEHTFIQTWPTVQCCASQHMIEFGEILFRSDTYFEVLNCFQTAQSRYFIHASSKWLIFGSQRECCCTNNKFYQKSILTNKTEFQDRYLIDLPTPRKKQRLQNQEWIKTKSRPWEDHTTSGLHKGFGSK